MGRNRLPLQKFGKVTRQNARYGEFAHRVQKKSIVAVGISAGKNVSIVANFKLVAIQGVMMLYKSKFIGGTGQVFFLDHTLRPRRCSEATLPAERADEWQVCSGVYGSSRAALGSKHWRCLSKRFGGDPALRARWLTRTRARTKRMPRPRSSARLLCHNWGRISRRSNARNTESSLSGTLSLDVCYLLELPIKFVRKEFLEISLQQIEIRRREFRARHESNAEFPQGLLNYLHLLQSRANMHYSIGQF